MAMVAMRSVGSLCWSACGAVWLIAAVGCQGATGCIALRFLTSPADDESTPPTATAVVDTSSAPSAQAVAATTVTSADVDADLSSAQQEEPGRNSRSSPATTVVASATGPGYTLIQRDYGPNPAAPMAATSSPPPLTTASQQNGQVSAMPLESPEETPAPADIIVAPYASASPPPLPKETPILNGGPAYESAPLPPRPGLPLHPNH
jgi:hypothetical protein